MNSSEDLLALKNVLQLPIGENANDVILSKIQYVSGKWQSSSANASISFELKEKITLLKISSQILSDSTTAYSFLQVVTETELNKRTLYIGPTNNRKRTIYVRLSNGETQLIFHPVSEITGFQIKRIAIGKTFWGEYKLWQISTFFLNVYKLLRKNPYLVHKFYYEVRYHGPIVAFHKSMRKIFQVREKPYHYTENPSWKKIEAQIRQFNYHPLISLLMPVYNVDPKWLEMAIVSVTNQVYENWELCIVDDQSTNPKTTAYLKSLNHPKIKVMFSKSNSGISEATNQAYEMAVGEYVGFLDNDDELTRDALFECVREINEKDPDIIYSDEDKIDSNQNFSDPFFKPDFSPDFLLSYNYITHFLLVKKSLIFPEEVLLNPQLNGAQDYDLILRLTERTNKIVHIPKVLYHWRKLPSSTSFISRSKTYANDAGLQALQNAVSRRKITAQVLNGKTFARYRVKYNLLENPKVSIIIPFRDQPQLLKLCLNSILEKTTYKNFEIIGISNNSTNPETFATMEDFAKRFPQVKFIEHNRPFNYSEINNVAVKEYSSGEHILLLNNDIEIISSDWIEAMLEHSMREEVGAVGAKLYYPNNTVQHGGVFIGIGWGGGHMHKHFPREADGYFGRLSVVHNVSAVTGACLMVKRKLYEEMNGLDEVNFKVAFNDVDFCLRLLEKGLYNVFTPFAEAYHHESISRGYDNTPEKMKRLEEESRAFRKRHASIWLKGDPFYNPNLTLEAEDFSLK